MNKFVMILVTLMVTLFGVNALAFEPPPAPADGTYVVDQTGKLSDAQKRQLNQKIEKVNRATKNEFGILLLGNMGGDTIEDVAYNTYKKWGVGKRGLDNGCLIVVSIKERKSRIETGKGVGGDVPDITAKKILDENLAPHLKRGDFYGGFDATLDALSSQIESRHAQKAEPKPVASTPTVTTNHRTNSGGCSVGTVVGAVGVGFGLIFLTGLIGVIALARYISRKAEERRQEEVARAQRQLEKKRRLQAELERKQREAAVAAEAAREREIKEAREAALRRQEAAWNVPTPPVPVPAIRPRVPRPSPRISSVPPPRVSAVPSTTPETPHAKASMVDASVAAAAATAAALAAKVRRDQEEAEERARESARRAARERAEREREQEEREAQARRDREQREREEQEREEAAIAAAAAAASLAASAFSWGSSSSDDSSSSSSYSSDDSSSGFGGGDSGGGGASSDWGSSDSSSSDDSGSSWDSGSSDDSSGSSSDW